MMMELASAPWRSIELGVQEGDPMINSTYAGYLVTLAGTDPVTPRSVAVSRGWVGEADDRGVELSRYSLTIQDE